MASHLPYTNCLSFIACVAPLHILVYGLSNLYYQMEKNEGSPEKSSSERDLRRRSPRRRPPTGNLPAGGSSSSSNAQEGQQNRPPFRVNQGMIRPSILMAVPLPPPRRSLRHVPAPPRVNTGKRVVTKPITGKTHSNIIGLPPGGPGIKKDSELVTRALSSSWTFNVPSYKGKAKLRELIERQPHCTTCGKTYPSWKGLFSHLRSHADCEYLGSFPPAKASNLNPQNGFRGMDLREQRELVDSLINAATVVSAMLDPVENDTQIGECSEVGTSSEPPPLPSMGVSTGDLNRPDESQRSLRNDGLLLDLNALPPDSDSEVEDPK